MIRPWTSTLLIFGVFLIPSAHPLWGQNGSQGGANQKKNFRPAPIRLSYKPEIRLEWTDTITDCEPEKICVEGQLYNAGGKTAYKVHLRVNIGGTKYIKPRTFLLRRVDASVMKPGDRQQFYIEIDRKVTYKDKKDRGKFKIMEVGKFNYKIVPLWSRNLPKSTK